MRFIACALSHATARLMTPSTTRTMRLTPYAMMCDACDRPCHESCKCLVS